MLLSQKLTLAYAALVGVGGILGFLKRKSTMSLVSGLVSSSLLLFVNKQLPENAVIASSIGLAVSFVLLVAMSIRFGKSGNFFPAGLVSLVSFVMTAGYLHGIVHVSSTAA